jgi:hypothetical protein
MVSVAPAHAAPKPSICYDVADVAGNWLPNLACNGEPVTPSGGLYGLGVEVTARQGDNVEYSAYHGGAWEQGKNGTRVGSVAAPITALSITISPRRQRELCYTVIDMNFKQSRGCRGQIVGSTGATAVPIRSILITITKP